MNVKLFVKKLVIPSKNSDKKKKKKKMWYYVVTIIQFSNVTVT